MLRYGIDLADRFQGAFDGRASVMLAPHAIDTCSRGFLKDVAAERDRMGVRVMTHVAQSRIEVNQVMARDGMTPMELVEDVGLLDERLIAAHCVVVTESDIARAGRAGITVAHCPKVNMTGGWLPQSCALRQAGARIAIGTDNMHGDVIEVLRWALASARLQEGSVGPSWQPEDVLHMATLGAATAMGRAHDLGSIAVGKQADLVLFDMRRAHLTPAFHPERTLVHCGTGRDVAMVIVAGTIVVEDGRATLVDEACVRRAGEAAATSVWKRVTGRDPRSRVTSCS
jgi:5-methylthioadenosine/S-adenosylhomocysteine deaminase